MFFAGLSTAAAAANYYLDLGWFGERAKLVLSAMEGLVMVSLGVTMRLWKDEPRLTDGEPQNNGDQNKNKGDGGN